MATLLKNLTKSAKIITSLHALKGINKPFPMQDSSLIGRSYLKIENPQQKIREFLQNTRNKMLQNPDFARSGTTFSSCGIFPKLGQNTQNKINAILVAASIGDSPTILSIYSEDKSFSTQLNKEQDFDDDTLPEKITNKTFLDSNGKYRYFGLAVPSIGHNELPELSKIQAQILEIDLDEIEPMAKTLGNLNEILKISISVFSDGVKETEIGEMTLGENISAPHATYIAENSNGKIKIEKNKNHSKQNEFSNLIKQENCAQKICEIALNNNSKDDLSAACVSVGWDDLKKELEENGSIIISVCDGNGKNGDIASKFATEEMIDSFQIKTIKKSIPQIKQNPENPTASRLCNDTEKSK